MSAPSVTSSEHKLESRGEAQQLIGHLGDVMDALVSTVAEETKLVRSGRLREAARLQDSKGDLTRLYVADVLRLRANQHFLAYAAPDVLAELRRRHDEFRALLQINLTVLATAHAVSEGIIRGVSGEIQRKTAPQTYGASGRASTPGRHSVQPLAVSRAL
jgi:hypothetical protein